MKSGHELDFCLLVPCYNNFNGLVASLKTVVYPHDKFLVVIVDDGSDPPLRKDEILQEVGNMFPIQLITGRKNLGITAALNAGLVWIVENTNTAYIARLDCGDLCAPERFTLQVSHLREHPDIGLIGTWCLFREKNSSNGFAYKTPTEHHAILRQMHFRNIFIHPTVMFQRHLLDSAGFYPEGYTYAEDYAFFWKLIKLKKGFVVNKFLVTCELNSEGISSKNRGKQLAARWKVVKNFSINPLYKIVAYIQLKILLILPKRLILQLKKLAGSVSNEPLI